MSKRAEPLSPVAVSSPKVRLFDRYTLDALRGSGSTGKVYRVVNARCAVVKDQIICDHKDRGEDADFATEVLAMSLLRGHPNIAHIIEAIHRPGERGAIVMVECAGPTLAARLEAGALSMAHARRWAGQLFRAVAFCHQRNIIHRDIKPHNLLLTSNNDRDARLVLADFGVAHVFASAADAARGAQLQRTVTTAWYRAPEMLVHNLCDATVEHPLPLHGAPCDVWAAGCVLFELAQAGARLGTESLFPAHSEYDLFFRMLGELGSPTVAEWPEGAPLLLQLGPPRPAPATSRLALKAEPIDAETDCVLAAMRDLVRRTVRWNPAWRMTAAEVWEAHEALKIGVING